MRNGTLDLTTMFGNTIYAQGKLHLPFPNNKLASTTRSGDSSGWIQGYYCRYLKGVDYFWSRGSLCGRTCRRISHGVLAIALLPGREIAMSVNWDLKRKIGLNVIEVDAVVL
jgi:hypothetical protein